MFQKIKIILVESIICVKVNNSFFYLAIMISTHKKFL